MGRVSRGAKKERVVRSKPRKSGGGKAKDATGSSASKKKKKKKKTAATSKKARAQTQPSSNSDLSLLGKLSMRKGCAVLIAFNVLLLGPTLHFGFVALSAGSTIQISNRRHPKTMTLNSSAAARFLSARGALSAFDAEPLSRVANATPAGLNGTNTTALRTNRSTKRPRRQKNASIDFPGKRRFAAAAAWASNGTLLGGKDTPNRAKKSSAATPNATKVRSDTYRDAFGGAYGDGVEGDVVDGDESYLSTGTTAAKAWRGGGFLGV